MPTLLQLHYFRLLAQSQHITKTSQELFITQTTLSRRIAQLEEELGVELFDRIGRNIYLNDYGRAFLVETDQIFRAFDRGRFTLENMKKENERKISVAMASSSLWGFLVKGFQNKYPDYMITQQEFVSDNVHDRLTMLKLDFVIAGLDDIPMDDLEYVVFRRDTVALCVPNRHRFASRKSIRLIEAKDELFISLSPIMPVSRFFQNICIQAGFTPKTVIECDYTLRPMMMQGNDYVSLTTQHTASREWFGDVTCIPIEDDVHRVSALFWYPKRHMSKACLDFKEYMLTHPVPDTMAVL